MMNKVIHEQIFHDISASNKSFFWISQLVGMTEIIHKIKKGYGTSAWNGKTDFIHKLIDMIY